VIIFSHWLREWVSLHLTGIAGSETDNCSSLLGGVSNKRGGNFLYTIPCLLQVDQAIGISQLLLMGTLGNFTLSKRSEILEKSSVNESLKDSLLFRKWVGLPPIGIQGNGTENCSSLLGGVLLNLLDR
jgi:hypothetical protein